MADDIKVNIGADPAGVEQGSRRAKVALKGVADGGRDLDAALRRLRTAVDPAFAAMERFNKTKADNLALMRAGIITRKEYNAGMRAAKLALDAETAAIERNSAAGRARLAAEREARAQSAQQARAAAAEETRLAREAAAATRAAAREAAAEAKRLKQEERAAARAAAAEAKRIAQEQVAAERQARRQATEEAKAALAEQRAADRAARAEEQAARRLAAEQERTIRRQQRDEARAAAAAAAEAAKQRAEQDRQAARASREAARAAEDQARAERQQAQSLQEVRASIDPAFAAQTRYNETMRKATELLMANKLAQGEWNAIQKQAQAQRDVNVRSLGAQNAMYVQLGYQAQDVTASLASGIDPLVILAQQAGQTAAAMSGMGGVMGRVAAFIAGPWGAAIIGATLLIAYLIEANKEAESTTKDLMDVEDQRKMSVKELTEALREYTKAQKQANDTTRQGVFNENVALETAAITTKNKLTQAQLRLNKAQQEWDEAVANPLLWLRDGEKGLAELRIELELAKREVKSLEEANRSAQSAATESAAAYAQTIAEMSELEKKEDLEKTKALAEFRRQYTAASGDAQAQIKIRTQYEEKLVEIQKRYNALKEAEAEARRKNEKAARDEAKATFQSRQQAIGVAGKELLEQGYMVGENRQFGGVKGNHPGMGNKAHGEFAIDINVGKGITEASDPVIRARMDEMVKAYQARGFRILWNGKVYEPGPNGAVYDIKPSANQHRDHAHIEAPQSIVGKPAGSGLANQLVQEAERQAEEARRVEEENLRAKLAFLDFEQELNREDLEMVLQLQDMKLEAIKDFYGESSQEAANAQRERVRIERSLAQEMLSISRDQLDQRLAMDEAAAEAERSVAMTRMDAQRDLIDFQANMGMLSPTQVVEQKAALLDQEYAQQVAHENRMLELKRKNIQATLLLSNLSDRARRELNAELEVLEAQHLNQMYEMQADYHRNVQAIQLESAGATLQAWRDVGSTLSNSLTSTFQGIWTHSQTLHEAFINMADQMVYKFVDMGAQMFQEWFMRQVGMTAVQQAQDTARTAMTVGAQATQTGAVMASQAAQTGARATAAATEQAITGATVGAKVAAEAIKTGAATAGAAAQTTAAATAGMSEVTTNAAVAAAGAYKSTVVIPFIGPVAAPAAAALALAAVLGFGALISAQGGQGEVPVDGQLSMLHKKEMVLPEKFAVPLRQMLVGPRSSAGMMTGAAAAGSTAREMGGSQNNANFYYQPNNTNMGAGFEELLRADSRVLRRWIKNEIRNGGLSFK